tara:strand:- start:68 stop:850 length:783 start_codon:yes stop_codon:yes gene_type:complete
MIKKTVFLLLLSLITSTFSFSQEKMTNKSILDLLELGFDKEIIKAKIESSNETNFNTSLEELKVLKEKGISSEILALMINKSKIEIETGVFFEINNKLVKIEPNVFAGTKKSALGAALTYGIVSVKTKSYVNNKSSSNVLDEGNSYFIFQFDNKDKNNLGSGNWWFKAASSPNEFALTKLKQKKNRRELVIGKINAITASSQMGVDTKKAIQFDIENLGNGKYRVKPKNTLEKGEYCFFYQGTIPMGGFNNQSIFDFSVK